MTARPALGLLLFSLLASALSAQGDDFPAPQILNPRGEMAVTGQVLIEAQQNNPYLKPFDIKSTRFEYSTDGETWTLIEEVEELLPDFRGAELGNWQTLWDTRELENGWYSLRTTMTTLTGVHAASSAFPIAVRKPPIPRATASPGDEPGSVIFDGSASLSLGGEIVAWTWEFDDGTVAAGPKVEHAFEPTGEPQTVYLTVADDKGFELTACFKVVFDAITSFFEFFSCDRCICKDVKLRGLNIPSESRALGPDGKVSGDKWEASKRDDGMTLGPFKNNPTNRALGMIAPVKWTYMGYAFEVVFEVEGDPADCKEGQLTKGTVVYKQTPGLNKAQCQRLGGTFNAAQQACTIPKSWTGKTADRDKDGTIDIDASTPFKCRALGGTVLPGGNCRLTFPQSGSQYGPDGYESDSYPSKSHPGKRVVWYDSPSAGGGIGSTQEGDFLAFLRGTDDRYCYIGFRLETERSPVGQVDEEDLTVNAEGLNTKSLPGVP